MTIHFSYTQHTGAHRNPYNLMAQIVQNATRKWVVESIVYFTTVHYCTVKKKLSHMAHDTPGFIVFRYKLQPTNCNAQNGNMQQMTDATTVMNEIKYCKY